jgi:stress response protein YsnF
MIDKEYNISHEKASKIARIGNLLKNLRAKVKKYAVIAREGQVVGEVRDLIIDINRQVNFVVSKSDSQENDRLILLSSKLVEKIDSPNKFIFINLKKSQVQYLPNYIERETQDSEMEDNLNTQEANRQNSELIAAVAAATNSQVSSVEDVIRLLGERLIIERTKHKVGEVIVRKEIETHIVQVPIRREKLIVEQISPEYKQLAQIDLGGEAISGVDLTQRETSAPTTSDSDDDLTVSGEVSSPKISTTSHLDDDLTVSGEVSSPKISTTSHSDDGLTVSGEFSSPKIASLLLNAIALERNHGCKAVRVTVIVEDEEHQKTYKEWFARTSKK